MGGQINVYAIEKLCCGYLQKMGVKSPKDLDSGAYFLIRHLGRVRVPSRDLCPVTGPL